MGIRTPVCELLGIDVPVVAAGMGGVAGAELAAAVSQAGGLGSIGAGGDDTATVLTRVREARRRTSRPFAVNFVLEVVPLERIVAVLEEGVDVLVTGWGDPRPLVAEARRRGTRMLHRVETAAEAARARDAGVDVVVAQGVDAGGHTGSVATIALVPAVVDAVAPTPVLAAGGVADGRGLAAALALGAQGAVLGTRFVAAAEARAHPRYKERVVGADETESVLTDVFELGWPGRMHRVLRNATVTRFESEPEPRTRPAERTREVIARRRRDSVEIERYFVDSPTDDVEGAVEDMALYAGPSAALVAGIASAAEILATVTAQAERVLTELGTVVVDP